MRFDDRYSTAVRASNLRGEPETHASSTDVLGAAALAGKSSALAMALLRLFVGDNTMAREIVDIMAGMLIGKAWHFDALVLARVQAEDIARQVLAWHRDGVCRACGGHGFALIPGTKLLGEHACTECRGTGRVPFDAAFTMETLHLARWLLAEVERETAKAGPAAMACLAPRLDL